MDELVKKFCLLLELERRAEELETEILISSQLLQNPKLLEARGVCIQRLQVTGQCIGMHGRDVVTFALAQSSLKKPLPLPSSTISAGCIVGIFASCKSISDQVVSGVLTKKTSSEIKVAFDELPSDADLFALTGRLQLVKMRNSATYKRMKKSLQSMKALSVSPRIHHFLEVMFGEVPLGPPHTISLQQGNKENFSFINPNLDSSQRHAVMFSLCQAEVAVIHGPPGTGKTTTLVEVILQAVRRGTKVLACAPSNIAVDNMVERLAKAKAKVVRLGHPARLVDSVQNYSLDALLSRSDSATIISDVRNDLDKAMVRRSRAHQSSDKRKWRTETGVLRKELKEREEKAIQQLLSSSDVVLSTTAGAYSDGPLRFLHEDHFGMVVIDECAQAIEASCWIPLLYSSKCVLAGDHKQLPPTIVSHEAASQGLSVSLMERIVELYGESVTTMLTTQYRMNEKIMQWPSKYLYSGALSAHESVAQHKLSDMVGNVQDDLTNTPLLFIDTAGHSLSELDTPDEDSKGNEGEADLVLHHLKLLLKAGVSPSDVVVIAPYNLQVELIRKRLPRLETDWSLLEVKSVDGFQGREKEAVIISFTRSNIHGQCGFLEEMRRSNVAITRAKRHLALIGDSDTLSHEPFLKGMLEYCSEEGEVLRAQEYISADDFEEHHFYEEKKPVCAVRSESVSTGSSSHSKTQHNPAKKTTQTESKVTSGETAFEKKKKEPKEECPVDVDEVLLLEAQVTEFMNDEDKDVFSFPSSLTSYQRMLLHKISEKLGLLHASKGEEPDRYIELKKPTQSSNFQEEQHEATLSESAVIASTSTMCPHCQKSVPKNNIIIHEAVCLKQAASPSSASRSSASPSSDPSRKEPAARPKSKSRKKTSSKVKTEPAAEEDLDSLLAEMTRADSICGHAGCKKNVNVLGFRCQFCLKRYCMSHNIPEVHGCGELAKKHARAAKPKPGPSSSNSQKRDHLHKKLEKKIEELTVDRQPKKTKPKSRS